MTRIDSITKSINLLYILLYSYSLFTPKHPTCSRRGYHFNVFCILLGTMVNDIFPTVYLCATMPLYCLVFVRPSLLYIDRHLSVCM